MLGPIAIGALVAGGTAVASLAPQAVSGIVGTKFSKKHGIKDFYKAQGEILRKKPEDVEGLEASEKQRLLAGAIRGIQAGAKGREAELKRQEGAMGFGRSGAAGEERTAMAGEQAGAIGGVSTGIEEISEQKRQQGARDLKADQAAAYGILQSERLRKMGRAEEAAALAASAVQSGISAGGKAAAGATGNVGQAIEMGAAPPATG